MTKHSKNPVPIGLKFSWEGAVNRKHIKREGTTDGESVSSNWEEYKKVSVA